MKFTTQASASTAGKAAQAAAKAAGAGDVTGAQHRAQEGVAAKQVGACKRHSPRAGCQ